MAKVKCHEISHISYIFKYNSKPSLRVVWNIVKKNLEGYHKMGRK